MTVMVRSDSADHAEINDLLLNYCAFLDTGQIQEWAECYTSDGIFEGPAGNTQGRDALVAYGRRAQERGFYLHFLSNVQIELVAEDRAAAQSYLLYVQKSADGAVIMVAGMQRDSLRREAGNWKIAHRTLTAQPILNTPGPQS